ncbi:hypothetical protein [Gemmata sp.]|uniref:hypothetical protein n=1 Tax=Gemmata sp. TaxID=1914242 RepID=UPI003F7307D6
MSDATKRLTRAEWNKTPYAGSEARDADGAVQKLLAKYGVRDVATVSFTTPGGRPGYGVRFVLGGRCYRIALETLAAAATEDELRVQAKRAVFHFLKSALELSNVFMPPEQVLFAFLELPAAGGATMYEGARPHLGQLTAPEFGRLMLPAKGDRP